MDEVQGPGFIRPRRLGPVFPQLGIHPAFGPLVAGLKAQGIANPENERVLSIRDCLCLHGLTTLLVTET